MKRLLVSLIGLSLLGAAGVAAAEGELLPLSEIEPGMRGVGRSEFAGGVIEEFEVEILGILRNAIGPRQDMILARLSGGPIEDTGVAAGMSGSPVYIDGRLIGAVSYRIGTFSREAIAGITPIHDMLKLQGLSRAAADTRSGEVLDRLAARFDPEAPSAPAGEPALSRTSVSQVGGLEPIRTPLVFSGFTQEFLESIGPYFEARGYFPVLGGGAGEESGGGEAALQPGAPVVGQLVRGDMGIGATCTLTWREADRVLACGHQLLRMGPVEVPMATGRVLHTLSTPLGSFKIAVPGEIVGQFLQDRVTAIYGEVGNMPEMIPVDLELRSMAGVRNYRFELFQNPVWTPALLFITLGNGIVGTTDFASASTIQMTTRIGIEGYQELEFQNVYSSLGGGVPLPITASLDVARAFSFIYTNIFEKPGISDIQVRMETIEESRFALVNGLRTPKVEVEAGEEMPVEVLLVPYRGEPVREKLILKVPEDTPPGPMVLLAGSHGSLAAAEGGLFGHRLVNAGNLEQVIRILGEERRNDHLYVKMYRKVSGALVQSEVLTDLPPSVIQVFNSKQVSERQRRLSVASVEEVRIPTDWIVVGLQRIELRVK